VELNAIGLGYQLSDFFSRVEVVYAYGLHAFRFGCMEETLLYPARERPVQRPTAAT
jgi:hypothetical protein